MRRLAVLGATAALAATAFLTPVGSPAGAEPSSQTATAAKAKEVSTRFAMHARGVGTKVRSNTLPVQSAPTATRTINCTNIAGKSYENFIAQVNVPELGTISGVHTRVWTAKRGGTVSTNARQRIAGIVLANNELGKLEITGLESRTRAFHDRDGYHVSSRAKVLGLKLTPAAGEPQELPLPTPEQPIEIPGLLKISIGIPKEKVTQRSAYTALNALDIQLTAAETRIKAGYSRTRIAEGIREGLFEGHAAGLQGEVLAPDNLEDPIVELGKTPLTVMPCEGTDGEVQRKPLVGVDIPGAINVAGAEVTQAAAQRRGLAWGWENAEIAEINLGDGELIIEAVKSRAVVRRVDGKLKRRAITSTARIIAQGESHPIPIDDPIEIPQLALIDPRVVEKIPGGIKVIALRITLLEGQGATIDLGISKMRIEKAR